MEVYWGTALHRRQVMVMVTTDILLLKTLAKNEYPGMKESVVVFVLQVQNIRTLAHRRSEQEMQPEEEDRMHWDRPRLPPLLRDGVWCRHFSSSTQAVSA